MKKNTNKIYFCPECGLKYQRKELARKCESWCKKHKSCLPRLVAKRLLRGNLEIIKHAIGDNQNNGKSR